MSKKTRGLIALDADGVLLDYNLAYARAWEKAFGAYPREKDPNAYWAMDRWDVHRVEGEELMRFRSSFDENFWTHLPALPGAIEACHALKAAGHDLVCVTALPPRFGAARAENLKRLGFPVDDVIAVDNHDGPVSPKAPMLHHLNPVAFVDDFLPYLKGVNPSIHLALISRETNGTPNQGEDMGLAASHHQNLREFSTWWTTKP